MGELFLKFYGWTLDREHIPRMEKCVLVAYPHTSNWDFPLMKACAYASGIDLQWLGKHTLFRGPGGPFFRRMGGVTVNRSAARGMVARSCLLEISRKTFKRLLTFIEISKVVIRREQVLLAFVKKESILKNRNATILLLSVVMSIDPCAPLMLMKHAMLGSGARDML